MSSFFLIRKENLHHERVIRYTGFHRRKTNYLFTVISSVVIALSVIIVKVSLIKELIFIRKFNIIYILIAIVIIVTVLLTIAIVNVTVTSIA